MRIVDSIIKMTECPNCGSKKLYGVYDSITHRTGGACSDCGETFEERSNPSVVTDYNFKNRKYDLILEAEDKLHDLTMYAKTSHELSMLEQVQEIFNIILKIMKEEDE